MRAYYSRCSLLLSSINFYDALVSPDSINISFCRAAGRRPTGRRRRRCERRCNAGRGWLRAHPTGFYPPSYAELSPGVRRPIRGTTSNTDLPRRRAPPRANFYARSAIVGGSKQPDCSVCGTNERDTIQFTRPTLESRISSTCND